MNVTQSLLNELVFLPSIWAVIFVITLRKSFKTKTKNKNKKANKGLFWYATLMFSINILSILKLIFIPDEISPGVKVNFFDYIDRMTGPYWWAFTSQYFAPFIFLIPPLIKKLRFKTRWIFLSILSMRFGNWFEKFVIIITSIHRHFYSNTYDSILDPLIPPFLIEMLILGFAYGGIIFYFLEYKKSKKIKEEIIDN